MPPKRDMDEPIKSPFDFETTMRRLLAPSPDEMKAHHKHKRGGVLWSESSKIIVDGYRYSAADCELDDCPFR